MSDYYQQEVTKYMMRRAKRRAAEPVEDVTRTTVEEETRRDGWLAGLRNRFAARGSEAEVEPTMPEKRPRLARQ